MALVLRGLRPLWMRGVLPATSASRKSAHSTDASGKIYEMRRYKIQPAKFTEYLRIASEKYEEVMTPHGKLVGYWASNMGSLNEVQHLWEYESYAHRDEVVLSKKSDKRVVEEYLNHVLPLLISQEHVIMRPFPWYTPKLEPNQQWGVYELVTQKVKPGLMSQLEHRVLQGFPSEWPESYPPPLAFWYSVFGNTNLFVSLWPHESFDKREEHRAMMLQSNEEWIEKRRDTAKFFDEVDVQGLTPLPWSPLQ